MSMRAQHRRDCHRFDARGAALPGSTGPAQRRRRVDGTGGVGSSGLSRRSCDIVSTIPLREHWATRSLDKPHHKRTRRLPQLPLGHWRLFRAPVHRRQRGRRVDRHRLSPHLRGELTRRRPICSHAWQGRAG
jgi:hypothetical protein